jgi:hypothetical protein
MGQLAGQVGGKNLLDLAGQERDESQPERRRLHR